jgi:hypothetical protein
MSKFKEQWEAKKLMKKSKKKATRALIEEGGYAPSDAKKAVKKALERIAQPTGTGLEG